MADVAGRYRGPWPNVNELLAEELDAYLVDAAKPELRSAKTACAPWTGDQLTIHLAETFRRFNANLARSRTGDLSMAFDRDGLHAENERAIRSFTGDPLTELERAVGAFRSESGDRTEVMAHQFGPIPVGLQALFGLSELAIHHDDLLAATVRRHRPSDRAVAAIAHGWSIALGYSEIERFDDRWSAVMLVSGRDRPPPPSAALAGPPALEWQRLGSRYGEPLILFETRLDDMRHPVSGRTFERLVLESVDWVNCVAVDENGRHVMVRQYRFGTGTTTLETPGGMVDDGEDSETAMRRELMEETGYGGGEWRYLGAVEPNPAVHNHRCHHWLATGVTRMGEPEPGPGEHIGVELLTQDEVVAAAQEGQIKHALALSVIARVLDIWAPYRPA